MPPRKGGRGGVGVQKRKQNPVNENQSRQPTAPNINDSQGIRNTLAAKTNQSKLTIAPLILEGVKLNKLQLNDMLKQHLNDVKLSDIQLSRAGSFTLYASDVRSFNCLLNDCTSIFTTNGQPNAKIYVPRSIQKIKDTEKVAFVKRVDLEIPTDRINEALKEVGLDVINVTRLNRKDDNIPTSTIKITFNDVLNRNTFVHTGLQVDSMHFIAEAASQNTKPVQCYICLQYNHIAKYCKTKQQVCARCGDNHRMEQCTTGNEAIKCRNCKGSHLATSAECPNYKEQEKRLSKLINQYSSTNKSTTITPAIHDNNEFPSLSHMNHQIKDQLHNELFDEIINVLTTKIEKIIEETTNRLFKSLYQKMAKIEKTITSAENLIDDDSSEFISDSDTEAQTANDKNNKRQQYTANTQKPKKKNRQPTTTTNETTSELPIITIATSTPTSSTTNDNTKKTVLKPQPKTTKRNLSLDSSLESATTNNKDRKTNNNND